ncbi:DUF1761 domain-containing protein [Microvirga alba]|uniref:DUF1761 domain-containing protein n=1 Tax=Microvirga alba TaxID=2791025 RepID=A0A931BU94_9HYPH|nr:DUF1761 domain-containing protein [Microvirga alba]MBF9232937.1 DUF1761 domain-containing protein [Microvirga alba]
MFATTNLWAILLAAIAAWLVGSVWYMVLAKPWMAALGKTKDELMGPSGKPSPIPLIVSFLAEIVMAVVLSGIIWHAGPVTVANGVTAGFLAWLGFVLTTMAVNHGFGGARPMLTVIDAGHWLAVLLIQGAIIGAFGR